MSNTKHRSLNRRLALLRKAAAVNPYSYSKQPCHIPIHCQGGMALDQPDLQRLLRDGHMKLDRSNPVPKWSKRFDERPITSVCSTDYIRRTCLYVTAAGYEVLKKHT